MAKKKTAKKTAAIKVRMYRQGLGDCFLITIPKANGEPFFVMIDCGVVLGSSSEQVQKLRDAVTNIVEVTGGKVDVLVATHEHWDHVSGFVQAETEFGGLRADAVWLAWTEDPKDKLAAKLRAERRTAEKALRMAVQHLALNGAADAAARVDSLVGFFGARAGTTSSALDAVKAKAANGPRYCEPGEPPISLPDVPAVRFWILGPPKDEKLIKKSNPGKGQAYGLDAGEDGSQRFLVSALTRNMGVAGDGAISDSSDEPFDAHYGIPLARAAHVGFFQRRYFGESTDDGIYDRSGRKAVRDQSWRRIDTTWVEQGETMALQLDAATNNTSLVIAIEIVKSGEILLFPGDAQAGNWLSWQALRWQVDGKEVTGPDLLARTVLYKVGHHGSHNATLRALGLEQMVSDKLMAMIPVDHEMAVKKRWGKMPLPDLVDRLEEKTHGRVLRVDDPVSSAAELPAAWEALAGRVEATELYFEISL